MSEDDIDEAFDLICEEAGEIERYGLRRHQIDQVTTFQTLGNSKRHRQLRSFLQDAFEALGANGAVLFAATLSQKRIDKLGRKRWLRLMQRIKASITLPDLKYLLPPWVRGPSAVLDAFHLTALYDPETGGLSQATNPDDSCAQSNTPTLLGATWLADPGFPRLNSDAETVKLANSKSTISPSWLPQYRELVELGQSGDAEIKQKATLYSKLLLPREYPSDPQE